MEDLEFPYPGFPSPVRLGAQSEPEWLPSESDWSSGREGDATQGSLAAGLSGGVPKALSPQEAPHHSPPRDAILDVGGDFDPSSAGKPLVDITLSETTPPSTPAQGGEPAMGAVAAPVAVGATAVEGPAAVGTTAVDAPGAVGVAGDIATDDGALGAPAACGAGAHGPEEPRHATDDVLMYECNVCHRAFTKSQALGGHMNTHRKGEASANRDEE